MEIKKFESFSDKDTPINYIKSVVKKIENKLSFIFNDKEEGSLSDLGLEILDTSISKINYTHCTLTIKMKDDSFYYTMYFKVSIDSIDNIENFTTENINSVFVKLKKYSINDDFNIIGEITKEVKINDINTGFLMEMKLELDEELGDDIEDLGIEFGE